MNFWKKALSIGLEEDCWQWDWTTRGTLSAGGSQMISAKIVAKSDGIWAAEEGVYALQHLSDEMGMPIQIHEFLKNGRELKTGWTTVELHGPVRSILALERPFLNLASYVSGVATQTRHLVNLVQARSKELKIEAPRVASTRKSLPGFRDLVTSGVIIGGGSSHRLNLSGGILIKENHIAAAGGITQAVQSCRAAAPHTLRTEVEVTSIPELREALEVQVDAVLLDNFEPAQVVEALKIMPSKKVWVEVSGGISAANIESYVLKGVDVISSGSITHSVKSVDLSLLCLK
ncbi:carboxylating nicotinate-nucleotide diphosphorylase [bacterium]|nr:carboxylating nicotinate-nucleotide diphosphorylase [bacterium]